MRASVSRSSSFGVVPDEIERVEAGDRAARDRDEREREQLAGEHRARAVDELRERRHLQRRQRDEDAEASASTTPIFTNADR